MIDTVLFDMDGVLIDSRESMRCAWTNVNTQFNLNIRFTEFLEQIGKPFESILTELEIDSQKHSSIKAEYGRSVSQKSDMIKVYRCIPYLLRTLKLRKIKIGVVTSKEYWRADRIVDQYVMPIDILICPEHTNEGKPSGEPILKALTKLQSLQKNCLYIGDMESDQSSAINAGVNYGHACWGYGMPIQGTAPVIFNYPEEILEFIY